MKYSRNSKHRQIQKKPRSKPTEEEKVVQERQPTA